MGLIFFALLLIAAAILFPEGTRAFVFFVIKATAAVVIIGIGLLIIVGLFTARGSVSPVQKVVAPRVWQPPRIITLSDGTQVQVESGWSDAE